VAPQHNRTIRWLWDRYLAFRYRGAFAAIHFNLSAAEGNLDPSLPVILIPNHISWWDGFMCFEIQRRLRPGSGIYSLMLETELRKFPVLRQVGCFGIHPGNPASVRRAFMQFRDLVTADPYRTLTFFPQGRISPMRQRPLRFSRGIELLVRLSGRVQCIPVALHIEPLNAAKPTFFVHAGKPIDSRDRKITSKLLEEEVTNLLDQVSITSPMKFLTEGT
jgi:1-acyl-sn-glycerol-3-phosphate acyltransferase